MSKDLNSVTIVGRLTRDPEFKMTSAGKELLKFSIANNMKSGDKESVSYFDVCLWGKFASVMKDYLARGGQVAVNGRLVQQRWEHEGQQRNKVEVIADNIQMFGSNNGSQKNTSADSGGGQAVQGQGGGPNIDDIPF
jgi:single-strand DNA-binding protein